MHRACLLVAVLLVVSGCASQTDQAGSSETPEAAGQAGAMPTMPAAPAMADPEAAAASGGAATEAPAKPPVLPAPAGSAPVDSSFPTELNPPSNAQSSPGTTREKAGVGSGKQGRSLDNETGVGAVIAQPARSLFAVRERAVFEFQIPQALQLFQGLEGRAPKSHEEFMTRIINANNIKLPELPAGHRYVYDPQRGELMVEKPGA